MRKIRESYGWTRVELARRSRIHPADISRIEGGRMLPYKPQLERLARALRVNQAALSEERQERESGKTAQR